MEKNNKMTTYSFEVKDIDDIFKIDINKEENISINQIYKIILIGNKIIVRELELRLYITNIISALVGILIILVLTFFF